MKCYNYVLSRTELDDGTIVKSKDGSFIVPDITEKDLLKLMTYFGVDNMPDDNFHESVIPTDIVDQDLDFDTISEAFSKKTLYNLSTSAISQLSESYPPNIGKMLHDLNPKYEIPNLCTLLKIWGIRHELDVMNKKGKDVFTRAFEYGCTSSTLYSNKYYRYVICRVVDCPKITLNLEGKSVARTTVPVVYI